MGWGRLWRGLWYQKNIKRINFLRDEFVYECNEYEFSKALFYAVVTLVIYGSHG
jgi:hypothetical protein